MITLETLKTEFRINSWVELYNQLVKKGLDKDQQVQLVAPDNRSLSAAHPEPMPNGIYQEPPVWRCYVADIKAMCFEELYAKLPTDRKIFDIQRAVSAGKDFALYAPEIIAFLDSLPTRNDPK